MPQQVSEVGYLIQEAIDAVASPRVREVVMRRAIELSGLDDIPETGRAVRVFIREHLRTALLEQVGPEVADDIIVGLSPLMILPTGGEITGFHSSRVSDNSPTAPNATATTVEPKGSKKPPPRHALRRPSTPRLSLAEPTGSAPHTVLFLTCHLSMAVRARKALHGRSEGRQVGTMMELLESLRDAATIGTTGAVVVIDCSDPTLSPTSILGLSRELPKEIRVLLIGPAPELELEVAKLDGRQWRTCGREASPEHIAELALAICRGPGSL